MKSLIITFFIGISTAAACYSQEPVSFHLKSLSIQGKTNVNHFRLSFDSSITHQVRLKKDNTNSEQANDEVLFRIPVKAFRADNPRLRKDFQTLLKAGRYPYIKVAIEKENLLDILKGIYLTDLKLELSLAGMQNPVQSQYDIRYDSSQKLMLEGLTTLNLKDFQLRPPQKMLGLIQVKNTILIKFDMLISEDKTAFKH